MIERYQEAGERETENGKSFYETQLLPDIDRSPEDVIVTIDNPDRLDRIAFRYYDDAKLWWVIAAANNLGRGDWSVPAGTRLRIPQNLSSVVTETRDINNR
jgi:nucleoid-associated protein YgaU